MQYLINHLKVIFMDISRWHRLLIVLFFLILISCNRDKYMVFNAPFESFSIRNWESKNKPTKVVLEEYKINSNFTHRVDMNSNFEIIFDTLRNRLSLMPLNKKIGKIDTDLKLTINDSLIFEISKIKTSRDTIIRKFGTGRTFHIFNAINAIDVNGNVVSGKNTGHIKLFMEMAKIQMNTKRK